MAAPSQPSLTRDRAWAYVMQNFSLAGWGTLKAGQTFAGSMQLATAFAGFFLVLAWMMKWIYRIFQTQIGDDVSPPPAAWLWETGTASFVISYTWTFLTCWNLMRRAKADELVARKNVPPKLENFSDKPPLLQSVADNGLPDWQRHGEIIMRTFQFANFPAALKFVNTVGEIAEQAQHHPDIDIRWNKVTLALTTHDAGRLTEKDFSLVRQCDALAREN
jgi:4a-hydroxytetrahydrobiopterin dehydratase